MASAKEVHNIVHAMERHHAPARTRLWAMVETPAAIIAAAKTSFLEGDQWAYTAGIVAVVLGAVLVWFMFPKRDDERRLLDEYHAADSAAAPEPAPGKAAEAAA